MYRTRLVRRPRAAFEGPPLRRCTARVRFRARLESTVGRSPGPARGRTSAGDAPECRETRRRGLARARPTGQTLTRLGLTGRTHMRDAISRDASLRLSCRHLLGYKLRSALTGCVSRVRNPSPRWPSPSDGCRHHGCVGITSCRRLVVASRPPQPSPAPPVASRPPYIYVRTLGSHPS